MTVQRFNHFNVSVADMEAAIRFWKDLLGLELTGRGIVRYDHLDLIVGLDDTKIEWAELNIPGGGIIELFCYHNPTGTPVDPAVNNPGTTHFALEVSDLDTLVRELQEAGITTTSRDAVRIPFGDWGGWKCIYVREPNGITIELLERPAAQ